MPNAYTSIHQNSRSLALWNRARRVAPRGAQGDGKFYEPFPHFIAKAEGAHIWDADGNRYLDYWNGAGPSILGHGCAPVDDAVQKVIRERGILYCAPHDLEVELAEELARLIPCADVSAFLNAGSDAICMAVRAARSYTGREIIIKFAGSYNGWYDGLLFNVSSYTGPPSNTGQYVPIPESSGLPSSASKNIRVLEYNDVPALEGLFEREGKKIAAVVAEPVMHGPAVGCILPDIEFLTRLRKLCSEYNSVLIFDEILTGFRHHIGGAQALLGVTPDLAAFGKAISNGYPLSALCGRRDIMGQLTPEGNAYFSGTYNGNVASVAAALATIKELITGNVYERLEHLGLRLCNGLNWIFENRAVDIRASNCGSLVAIHFMKMSPATFEEVMTKHDALASANLVAYLISQGIFVKPRRVPRFVISTAHRESDIDRTVDTVSTFLDLTNSSEGISAQ